MAAHTFSGSIDGTFDAGVGIATPSTVSATATEPVMMALSAHGRMHLPTPDGSDLKQSRKLLQKVMIDVPEPFVVRGQPVVPRFFGRVNPVGTALVGVGHMREFADPDPVWNPLTHTWDVHPPNAPPGVGFVRWTVKDLPDPEPTVQVSGRARPIVDDTLSHGYLLGDRSVVDGTDDYPAGCQNWPAAGGSTFSPSFLSAYPFKPMVKAHVHLGEDGSSHTQTKGVHLRPSHVTHMWADLGTFLEPPFTIVVVAVIKDFRHRSYQNWLLDSGRDPTDNANITVAKRQKWLAGVPGDVALDDEDLGYRSAIRVSRSRMHAFTDQNPTTRIGSAPFQHKFKPKMFIVVVDGAHSMVGDFGVGGSNIRNVHFGDHGAQRFVVLGRKNGIISAEKGCSAVVFEIRMWDTALTPFQIVNEYDQLSTTWRFHDYH